MTLKVTSISIEPNMRFDKIILTTNTYNEQNISKLMLEDEEVKCEIEKER